MKPTVLAPLALWILSAAGAVHADSITGPASSAGSSASSAGSASLGSISDSIRGSSDSSSGQTKVTDGNYRVIQVAQLTERPGMLRLTLRGDDTPAHRSTEFTLDLPRRALATHTLAAGDLIQARQRPYGIEFAHAAAGAKPREPFFLVLADDWQREIDPRAVKL